MNISLDGCKVYLTSAPSVTEEPLIVVRDILLSAYRPRQEARIIDANTAKWDNNSGSNDSVAMYFDN